jgi:hypothetical protein
MTKDKIHTCKLLCTLLILRTLLSLSGYTVAIYCTNYHFGHCCQITYRHLQTSCLPRFLLKARNMYICKHKKKPNRQSPELYNKLVERPARSQLAGSKHTYAKVDDSSATIPVSWTVTRQSDTSARTQ